MSVRLDVAHEIRKLKQKQTLPGIRGVDRASGTLRVCLIYRLGTLIAQKTQDLRRPVRSVREETSNPLAQGLNTEIIFLTVPLHTVEESGNVDQLGS